VNRRAITVLLDQAVSAAGNVALAIVVLHRAGLDEFAGFGFVWAAFLMLQELGRAAIGEPMLVSPERAALRQRQVVGLVLAVATVAAAALSIPAGLLLSGSVALIAAALLLFLPALLVLDTIRFVLFTAERPGRALLLDTVWTSLFAAGTAVLLVRGTADPAAFVAVWGATGTVATALGLLLWHGLRPSFAGTRAVLPLLRPGRVFTLEILAERGAYQASLLLTQVVATPAAAGLLHVGRVLLGPANLLYQATSNVVLPRATRMWRAEPDAATRMVRLATASAAAGAVLAVGVVLLVPALRTAIGDAVSPARLAVPVMVAAAANGLRLGPRLLLRIRGSYVRGARIRAATSVLALTATVAGAWGSTSVTGAVWGYAVGSTLGAVVWSAALGGSTTARSKAVAL
jgi:O-antigen/teichoic acid export membrane protein